MFSSRFNNNKMLLENKRNFNINNSILSWNSHLENKQKINKRNKKGI